MRLRRASSSRFTHTIRFGATLRTCSASTSVRSRHVASHTTTTASASPLRTKSHATASSAECGHREYVPGMSTNK